MINATPPEDWMMKEVKLCPHCGAKMTEYKHSLSKNLLRGFVRVVKASAPSHRFSFKNCENLSYSQAANLQKLKYWLLIRKPNDDDAKGGEWIITDLAFAFLAGEVTLNPNVWTYRGITQRYEGEPLTIMKITGGWRYRPDYVRDRIDH
jgi:hypothetical protein